MIHNHEVKILFKMRNAIFTTLSQYFLQQIINVKLLLVVEKLMSMMTSNYNQ